MLRAPLSVSDFISECSGYPIGECRRKDISKASIQSGDSQAVVCCLYHAYKASDAQLATEILSYATPAVQKISIGAVKSTFPAAATFLSQFEPKVPWYKNWKILLGIGGGVLVVGGGAYLLLRTR